MSTLNVLLFVYKILKTFAQHIFCRKLNLKEKQVMVKEGHQGIVRFAMLDTEMTIGQIGFGESSLYPTSFDGAGGNFGLNAAVPTMGSRP